MVLIRKELFHGLEELFCGLENVIRLFPIQFNEFSIIPNLA